MEIYQYSLIFQREISVFFRYVEISERKKAINDYISSGNVNIVRIVGGNSGKQFEQSDMWTSGMARAKHIISNILTGNIVGKKIAQIWNRMGGLEQRISFPGEMVSHPHTAMFEAQYRNMP